MAKRAFDLFFSALGLLLLSPLLLLLAIAVKVSSRGPILFRQQRVGKDNQHFSIYKFRSMVAGAEKLGPSVTRDGDPRITTLGRFLRKTKLDELPQLWNVLVGDMSLVGPRPEVPRYVEKYTAPQARVLALKPGVTDLATLEFRSEEELLGSVADPERFYVEQCIPRKIELNLAYAKTANVWEDIKIIIRTLRRLVVDGEQGNKRRVLEETAKTGGQTQEAKPAVTSSSSQNPDLEGKAFVGEQGLTGTMGGNGNGSASLDVAPPSEFLVQPSRLPHFCRRAFLIVLAGYVLFVCRWLAYQFRFDFVIPKDYQVQLRVDWIWAISVQLFWLLVFRQFSGIYKYFSLPEVRGLAYAMIFSGYTLFGIRLFDAGISVPKGVILVQCMTGFLTLGGLRSLWRLVHERYLSRRKHPCQPERKVAIIGAGDAAADLTRELYSRPNLGLVPVAFFDDDQRKWGSEIHGIPVVGPPEQLQRRKAQLDLEEAVIAMPSAPAKRIAEVVSLLQKAHLKYVTVPSVDQLTSGAVRVSQLRPVNIEDLLGREAIDLKLNQIGGVLKDRTVLVTGAGGSIGSELCRQVAAFRPRRLVLVDQSEVQLFQIQQQLLELGHGDVIVPVIADILDRPRMNAALEQHRPAVIYHAAAHKHVMMMEIQPSEAIKNNTLGTSELVEMAAEHGVERFVLISTDKAVNPTSVMGTSKRLAEMFLQSFAREHPGRTKFAAVRFGNVLGSSGSVVPIFERQIAAGGPLTVTDPEVVRFFMTIPEAVGLVLQSSALGQGGEIFVLDMGKPIKIVDLARHMIRLSGLEPDRDIEIKFIGLRPGEKLYEELHHLRANCTDTAHPRIKRLASEPVALQRMRAQFQWLSQRLHTSSPDELKRMMKAIAPEYTPNLTSDDRVSGNGGREFEESDLFPDTVWAAPLPSRPPLVAAVVGRSA